MQFTGVAAGHHSMRPTPTVRFGILNLGWFNKKPQEDEVDLFTPASQPPAYPQTRFYRVDPNVALQTLSLQELTPQQLVFLVEAFGVQSASNPAGVISESGLRGLQDRRLKEAIERPFEKGYHSYGTKLQALASELAANRNLFTSTSYTMSVGGAIIPSERANRAFRIGMPWEMSFDDWYQNVTLYAPLSPYKLNEALKGIRGIRGPIPKITVPDRIDPSRHMGSDSTHKYQLKTVEDLEKTYEFFMRQDSHVQQQILRNMPWFTNTHSAWHHMSYATGKEGEYLERIFPGHFWLGMSKLPMFAISVPRTTLEVLHRSNQISLEGSHPGIDRFDYYGIPDPDVPNLSQDDRYVTRTLAEGELLAGTPPNHPIRKPSFDEVKTPYSLDPYEQGVEKRINARLKKTRSIKPLLSYEELERSVTGQVIRANQTRFSNDPTVNGALADLDKSFSNWQHMTVRDYWHTSYHLDMNNHIEAGMPVKQWHITPDHASCNEWYPCENAVGCNIPVPMRSGKGGINLDKMGQLFYSFPNPQMWDILTYHAFNTFDVMDQNPDYMYSNLTKGLSPQGKALLKAKLGYLIQANLGFWRRESIPPEAQRSVQELLNDPIVSRFFPPRDPKTPGVLPSTRFDDGSTNLLINTSGHGFYTPVVTMLQYVPHGSENNNPLHHGGPPA